MNNDNKIAGTVGIVGGLGLAVLVWALLAGASGCGLDDELLAAATDRGHVRLPEPRDNVVVGKSTPGAGGAVAFTTGGGAVLPDATSPVGEDGVFEQHFDGRDAFVGLLAWVTRGDRVLLGLVPDVPRQPTVFHDEHVLPLWDELPAMADLNAATTAVTMITSAAAQRVGVSLDGLSPGVLRTGVDDVVAAAGAGAASRFAAMVAALDQAAAAGDGGTPVFQPDGVTGGSFLSAAWLAAVDVDYDGDGARDLDTGAFDAALAEAAAGVEIGVCYPPDTIRVVFHVDLREGVLNRNCSPVNPYKWAEPAADKRVFLAGGIHEDTPVCGPDRADHCLTAATVDAVNEELGGWVPNVTPMYDDGTHGDAASGDGVWTAVFDLPYIPTATSPDGAGVRMAYKYTFGLPGQNWTGSEEWPGNQRLLELEDLNGDHLIVRYDIFGDEAANKDKVNALKLAKGGCGTVQWEADRDPSCAGDSRENRIDTDGDCVEDAWDHPGPVAPLTVPCQ